MSYPISTLTDRMRYVLMGRSADTHGVISEAITEIESLRAQLAAAKTSYAALDDLNVIEAQARRMIADVPPYDGNDRRGK